ncbi:hypothetical protein SDC9_53066 [bioreactor metagenome]|uniref:Uncharacterized protein n=1 Tax=bioreactor metagenome TaxID=1076179 RepID=A0A644WXJ5_9ZZZZ
MEYLLECDPFLLMQEGVTYDHFSLSSGIGPADTCYLSHSWYLLGYAETLQPREGLSSL